jgi:hypothetical protein
MAMMQTRQRVVSDEVKHEVEQALNATRTLWGPKTALHQAIGHVFSARNILDLAGNDRLNPRGDEPQELQQLVLDDAGTDCPE